MRWDAAASYLPARRATRVRVPEILTPTFPEILAH
jgi:hypothetical protein